MAHRDFNVLTDMSTGPTFTLRVETPDPGGGESKFDVEEFHCISQPPAGILADILISTTERIGHQTAAIVSMITGCLVREDEERFREVIRSKDKMIPLEMLVEIMEWLIEEYGKPRPTMPSSGSVNGSGSMPDTSEGGADSQESTPEVLTS